MHILQVMLNRILGRFTNNNISRVEKCVGRRSIDSDFDVLQKCVLGKVIEQGDRQSIQRLASVGYVRMGTTITMDDLSKTIQLQQTAKITDLGSRVLQKR